MFEKLRPAVCAALVASACAVLPAVARAAAVAANTAGSTPRGTQLLVPKGWTLEQRGAMHVLTPPEDDSHLVVVESNEKESDAAVAAAWRLYRTGPAPVARTATDGGADGGWDATRQYDYTPGWNAPRLVQAAAFHAKAGWTVALVDMARATAGKRGAQQQMIFDRLYPAGYRPESFAGRTAHPLDASRVEALSDFIRRAQRDLHIPGVALGLVQDGKVVFAGGFGVRAVGRSEPVDARTRFLIASNTKALTTLMLAKLVEQGRFRWDTPVVKVMPDFALGDAAVTRRVQIQHLVCACTGLPRQDMEWIYEYRDATPASTLHALAGMQPTSDFGDLFQYSNSLAAAAGYVGAYALYPGEESGSAYDRAMQSLVFDPLGMHDTTFDYGAAQTGNHATGHADDVDGVPQPLPEDINRSVIPMRPAGGAWSTVDDMLKYVTMELDRGRLPDGRRYIDASQLEERRAEKVLKGADAAYGMGLIVSSRYGTPVVYHGGSLWGHKSDMMWLPEHGVGAVLLTNSDMGGDLLGPFRRRLLELLFDGEPVADGQLDVAARALQAYWTTQRQGITRPADPKVVAGLARRYASPDLGTVDVRTENGATVLDFGEWRTEIGTRVDDTGAPVLVYTSPSWVGLELTVGRNARGRTLSMLDDQHSYVFEEVR